MAGSCRNRATGAILVAATKGENMEWMLLPLKRYAQFSGRSRRKEYWMFLLFTILASIILGIIDAALGLTLGGDDDAGNSFGNTGVLGGIFSLATLIPSIAVGVRRLHDINRTGWWLLMPVGAALVAGILGGTLGSATGTGLLGVGVGVGLALAVFALIIGGVLLLVFYCLEGTRGPNRFGPDPKDPAGTADLHEVFC